MTYISADLRRQVIDRAGNCCEYCRLSQEDNTFSFQIDHVIAEKHDGETILENLSLSCPYCNSFKGSDIGSIDRETGQLTPLYNPRTQNWDDHFHLDGPVFEPLTPEGRVT
ncbi:MAG TPA: HNH endonuclease signature motif containing protein [Spirillospora sp.]|nr:HNH endonuclease signature motif containing protein [Spirillospora sp.]